MTPALLAEVTRGDEVESRHYGWIVVVDRAGYVVERFGSPVDVFPRSSLKPFQGWPLLETGTARDLGLTDADLAIACSSHAGTPEHVAGVRALLAKAGISPEALRCGVHEPLNDAAAAALRRAGEPPGPLHHNCSGKHAAMLAVCRHEGWDPERYLAIDHPLQVAIRGAIARFSDLSPETLRAGVDGCGVPAWYLPLDGLARAFARLVSDPELAPLARAMAQHPRLVSGPGRFDTVLMEAMGDRLITKAGAEGVHAGGDRRTGLAWAVKVADGNRRAIPPIVLALLERHGLLESGLLADWAWPAILNRAGRVTGNIRALKIDETAPSLDLI